MISETKFNNLVDSAIIRHAVTGQTVIIVDHNHATKQPEYTAIRITIVSNRHEWELIKE